MPTATLLLEWPIESVDRESERPRAAGEVEPPDPPARRPSLRHPVKNAIAALAALGGLLCVVWLGVSVAFGLSVVIFLTGSMAPTIPTGSAALVRPVAAADLVVGDVVTVVREGTRIPITHRIVSITDDPDVEEGRLLVLRGDANDADDPFPYPVTEAGLVVAATPGLGSLMLAARTPAVTSATTLLVAALVVWILWPVREAAHRARGSNA